MPIATGMSLNSSSRAEDSPTVVSSRASSRIVLTAAKKWRSLRDRKVKERLLALKEDRRQRETEARERARVLARKIPVDVLAREWLNETKPNVETRAFLLDKLLPTLILAVEKLLTEVSRRKLEEQEGAAPDFNPVNFLAQYLMRNNPRFVHFSDSSPYMRGIQAVADELKNSVFALEENRLAKVKAETRRKRQERKRQEAMKDEESKRRRIALAGAFRAWVKGGEVDVVEMAQVQAALQSFQDVTEFYPEEMKKLMEYPKPIEDDSSPDQPLDQSAFTDYLYDFVRDFSREVFDAFNEHVVSCGQRITADRQFEKLKSVMADVFMKVDIGQVGLIDRHQVLKLLERFYETYRLSDTGLGLRDPERWPVVEIFEQDILEGIVVQPTDDDTEMNSAVEVLEGGQKVGQQADTTSKEEPVDEQAKEDREETTGKEEDGLKKQEDNLESEQQGKDGQDMKEDKARGEDVADEGKASETAKKGEEAEGVERGGDTLETGREDETTERDVKQKEGETRKPAVEIHVEKPKVGEQEDVVTEKTATDDRQSDEKVLEDDEAKVENREMEKTVESTQKDETAEHTHVEVAQDDEERNKIEQKNGTEEEGGKGHVDESTKLDNVANQQQDLQQTGDVTRSEELVGDGETARTSEVNLEQEERSKSAEQARVERSVLRSRTRPRTRSRAIGSLILETPIVTERGPGSIFDPTTLNESQFIQLIQTFLGEQFNMQLAEELAEFLAKTYGENDDQREKRRSKSRAMVKSTDRKTLINQLFDNWDRNCSGFLEVDELQMVLRKWKGLDSRGAKEHVREVLDAVDNDKDQKLNRCELQAYIELLADDFPGDDDAFEEIVHFLTDSVDRTYEEQRRGEARMKFLETIRWIGKTTGINFEPLYRNVFSVIQRDAAEHGGEKVVSARIGMLETSEGVAGDREDQALHYVAATFDDKEIVGHRVHRTSKRVCFAAVDLGKPLYIPTVSAHGGVQMIGARGRVYEDAHDGSLILLPLKNNGKRVIGVLAVDTVADPPGEEFAPHEISFYQGVAKTLSSAYIYKDIRLKILRITQSAIAWIHRRCPSVVQIAVYLVEPKRQVAADDYVLRKMLSTDARGESQISLKQLPLARKDNLFRDYLFKCVDQSETVTAVAYGHRRIAYPLRNSGGYTMFVLDISVGQTKVLLQHQNDEMSRMLKLLMRACAEVSQEVEDTEDPECVLEAESVNEDVRISVLFDRLILMELRENVEKLRPSLFSELKSYVVPPTVVHCVIQAVLNIFFPEQKDLLTDWHECKQLVSPDLLKKIYTFDPTASSVDLDQSVIVEMMQNVPHGEVLKHGSKPAELLYNWLYVCLSLIEHTSRMKRNELVGAKGTSGQKTEQESSADSSLLQNDE